MNFSFQAIVLIAMCVQKGLQEGCDITDLLEKMEFFLNNEGQLQVHNVDDYRLDLSSILVEPESESGFEFKQIDLFDTQDL